MRRKEALAAVALLLLAGCLGHATVPAGSASPAGPPGVAGVEYRDASCRNVLLFQFVEFHATDGYLPPGFHPRDPQGFLGSPVAIGKAGVVFLELSCLSRLDGPMDSAAVGIFVEPPMVAGLAPGLFDFYEVQRYGPDDLFSPFLRATGWPAALAGIGLSVGSGTLGNVTGMGVTAAGMGNVTDAFGDVVSLTAVMASRFMVGTGTVRFWHQTPDGLAYLEFHANLDALVGSGECSVRSGTPLAAFTGESQPGPMPPLPLLGAVSCPPGEPIFANFPGLTLTATARQLPGVHAG